MTTALLRIAVTFGVLVGLGSLWFGLQVFIRWFFPAMAPAGSDPFRARFGCGEGCGGGACGTDAEPGSAC